jgi:uncharacterized repeat protein (TIGR01451 family)
VDTDDSQIITNHAMIGSPGYEPITATATISTEAVRPPNLAPSYKTAYPSSGNFGDHITYTVVIRSSAGPLSNTVQLTDTIPGELLYVSGTLTGTTGVVSDTATPTLYWTGVLSPTPVVTLTYAVTVDTEESAFVANSAALALSGYGTITRTVPILVNSHRLYLPLVLREAMLTISLPGNRLCLW